MEILNKFGEAVGNAASAVVGKSDPAAAAKAKEQAADTKIAELKQQLETAEEEKAAAVAAKSAPVGDGSDGVPPSQLGQGRKRKTRKGGKKSRKVKRRRTGRKSNRS